MLSVLPLKLVAFALLALAMLFFTLGLFLLPGESPRPVGARARLRARALTRNHAFRAVDPLIRWMSARLAPLLPEKARARLDRALVMSGDPLGLVPPELAGAAILAVLAGALLGIVLGASSGRALAYGIPMALVAGLLPVLAVREAMMTRRAVISRELPAAIDSLALAVSAGLDFPGAIRQVVDTARDASSPLVDELTRVLESLTLGQTRREALLSFADRVPVPGVVEFVQSVVQAEEKGNPVMEVLLVQAQESRMKRSARAEEAASRAGVAMTLPLFLMFGCTMILVLGPIILNVPRGLGN